MTEKLLADDELKHFIEQTKHLKKLAAVPGTASAEELVRAYVEARRKQEQISQNEPQNGQPSPT